MKSVTSGMMAAMVGAAMLPAMLTGCESSTSSHEMAMVGNRPLVKETAVEQSPVSDAGGLGFFDALEAKPLASQDDAIHSMLLLGTGVSGGTYEQRVAMAKKLGYVDGSFGSPARQAVTMGEIASMATRILEGKPTATQEDAMARLVRREIVPAAGRANQGMTGAQLVSITGGVRDAMTMEGVQRVAAPKMWEVMAAVENPEPVVEPVAVAATPAAKPVLGATPVVASTPKGMTAGRNEPMPPDATAVSDVALSEIGKGEQRRPVAVVATLPPSGATASAPAGTTNASGLNPMAGGMAASNVPPALQGKGRAEPLPQIPVGTQPPAIELQDPSRKPSVITPDEKVFTPGQPKGKSGGKVNTSKPVVKPVEPKKDAPAKDGAKGEAENEWTNGKPVKEKTAGADEPK